VDLLSLWSFLTSLVAWKALELSTAEKPREARFRNRLAVFVVVFLRVENLDRSVLLREFSDLRARSFFERTC
jgi:hypothetical protein